MKTKLLVALCLVGSVFTSVSATSSGDLRELAKAYDRRDMIDIVRQAVAQEKKGETSNLILKGGFNIKTDHEETMAILKLMQQRNLDDIKRLSQKVGVEMEQFPLF